MSHHIVTEIKKKNKNITNELKNLTAPEEESNPIKCHFYY